MRWPAAANSSACAAGATRSKTTRPTTPGRQTVQRAESAKQRIARWAAELIENGDTIALDASTTVYRMASFLKDRRNLTMVTNGIEVGRKLAQNPANTVMLLGGCCAPTARQCPTC